MNERLLSIVSGATDIGLNQDKLRVGYVRAACFHDFFRRRAMTEPLLFRLGSAEIWRLGQSIARK
jgi:hypothetical protein